MNPYVAVCKAFNRARIKFVTVGVYGINFYSKPAGTVVTTADCDLLLPPDPKVLATPMRILRRRGFQLEAGGEPQFDEDSGVVANIVRARACVRASKGRTIIDLPLEIAGFGFPTLWRKRRVFKAQGVSIPVAPLECMIRSKQLANRPKDRYFLETYLDALQQLMPPAGTARRPRKKK